MEGMTEQATLELGLRDYDPQARGFDSIKDWNWPTNVQPAQFILKNRTIRPEIDPLNPPEKPFFGLYVEIHFQPRHATLK